MWGRTHEAGRTGASAGGPPTLPLRSSRARAEERNDRRNPPRANKISNLIKFNLILNFNLFASGTLRVRP